MIVATQSKIGTMSKYVITAKELAMYLVTVRKEMRTHVACTVAGPINQQPATISVTSVNVTVQDAPIPMSIDSPVTHTVTMLLLLIVLCS